MKSDLQNSPPKGEKCYIDIYSNDYPDLLKNIYDPPRYLFFKGNKNLLKNKNLLTIVGSRKTTSYHQSALQKIIADFKGTDLVIVSGLALGIDGLSHRYALDNNLPTIAVLGSSLDKDNIYPQENLPLAKEIIAKGGLLLSEQNPGTQTRLWHFPKRNRILAGMSRATIVISGAKKSGTLITAQVAVDEGRDVFALPANINLSLSYGPNQLIKNGASILTTADDILKYYHLDKRQNKKSISFNKQAHAKIYSTLQTEPVTLVELARQINFSLSETSGLVSEMEIQGLIKINQFNQIEII